MQTTDQAATIARLQARRASELGTLPASANQIDQTTNSQIGLKAEGSLNVMNQYAPRESKTHLNYLTITTNSDGSFVVGKMPFMLSAYDYRGEPATGLVSDLRNTVLDVSQINGRRLNLGFQLNNETMVTSAWILADTNASVFIDDDSVVYPGSMRNIETNGPYMRLQFRQGDGKLLRLDELAIEASSRTQEKYETEVTKAHAIIIKQVRYEPINIVLTPTNPSIRLRFDCVEFPKFRGATPDVVSYIITGGVRKTVLPNTALEPTPTAP